MFVSKKKIKKESGFSLIELMVVVGIIGILAAVAVPQFSKFQAKARQSEAKTGLSALVTAEKGFATEYGGYTIDLVNVGFSVEGGQLRYNYGFPNVAAACATMANAPTENSGYKTLQAAVSSGGISTLNVGWAVGASGPTNSSATAYDVCTDTGGAPPVFTGVAYGDPTNSPTATGSVGKLDVWTVDQLSNLKNQVIGY